MTDCNRPVAAALLCGALLLAPPAQATGAVVECEDIDALMIRARSNFTGPETDTPPPLPGAERCFMAQALSGANVFYCAWPFAYRDAAARAALDEADRTLRACLGTAPEPDGDKGVNHPDSYTQYRYRVGAVAASVSLKDKSALRQTYIFVGIHGAAPE